MASRRGGFIVAATVGTMLSIARTGQITGIVNHHFHLPILVGLPALPQFAHDPFVQALPYYSSGLWQMLAGRASIETAPTLLLALGIASRLLTIAGLLACATLVGIERLKDRLIFVALATFSVVLNGYSVGGGGLFLNYFTHSEVAFGTILWSVWFAAQGRHVAAFALNGVTFFINIFMGAWALAPLGAILVLQIVRRDADRRAIARRAAIGVMLFGLLAVPTIRAVIANPDFGKAIGIDYRAYLTEYFPEHFLIWSLPTGGLFLLALVTVSGLMAAILLARADPRAAFVLAALAGFILLWVIGVVLPFATASPTLINLHLLRADGGIHLFGGFALCALTTGWLAEPGSSRRRIWAPLLVFTTISSRLLLPVLPLLMGLGSRRWSPYWGAAPARVAMLLLALVCPWQIVQRARENAALRADVAIWTALGRWARENSAPDAIFMLPVGDILTPSRYDQPDPAQRDLAQGSEVFLATARRRVWIDFRGGAAVMWRPSYYPLWHARIHDLLALPDHRARLAYARAHKLSYLIDGCANGRALFAAADRCIYRVGR